VDFTFRTGDDVVRLADVPAGFAAVLSGHIHRSQVLDRHLSGQPCPTPVFYPGSLERTAFAERDEPKGFMTLRLEPGEAGGSVADWTFHDVGARPMEIRPLRVSGLSADELERALRTAISAAPSDAVLRLEADGPPSTDSERVLGAERLRRLTPETMNVEVRIPGFRRRGRRSTAAEESPRHRGQGDLFA
jgi:DNA repair exonuclease SbcCD nuclease subunit